MAVLSRQRTSGHYILRHRRVRQEQAKQDAQLVKEKAQERVERDTHADNSATNR